MRNINTDIIDRNPLNEILSNNNGQIIASIWNTSNIKPMTAMSFNPQPPNLIKEDKTLTAQQCANYLLSDKYYRVIVKTSKGQIITLTLDEYVLESNESYVVAVAAWLGIKNLNYSKRRINGKLNADTLDFTTLLWLLSNNTLKSSSDSEFDWLSALGYSNLQLNKSSPPKLNINLSSDVLFSILYPRYFGDTSRPYLWFGLLTGIMILKSSIINDFKNEIHNLMLELSPLQVIRLNRLLYANNRIIESVNTPYEELAIRLDRNNLWNEFNKNILKYNHKNYKDIVIEFGLKPKSKESFEEYMRFSLPYIVNIFDNNKTDYNVIKSWGSMMKDPDNKRVIDYYRDGHRILTYYTDTELLNKFPKIKYGTRYELATYILQKLVGEK